MFERWTVRWGGWTAMAFEVDTNQAEADASFFELAPALRSA